MQNRLPACGCCPNVEAVRIVAVLVTLIAALAQAPCAFAHASLVRAEPADGAVVAEAPVVLRLVFNEPVSPLVMRLIGPTGESIVPPAAAANTVVTVTPPQLRRGTHVLSWRVVSADGHPVGGTLTFSVGEASAQPAGAVASGDVFVRGTLWTTKFIIYAALVIGVGGAFFRSWMMTAEPWWLSRALIALMAVAQLLTPLSVGLQGLDALDLPLSGLTQHAAWQAGYDTSYSRTAIAVAVALFVAMFAFEPTPRAIARPLSLAAVMAAGIALALSGHASNAAPQMLTRPSVFLHVVCAALWIGALMPLLATLRSGEGGALSRFTRAIPYPLAALIVTGATLAVVQLDRIDALWTTSYGIVLSCKLAAIALLLALAVANRYVLVPRLQGGDAAASAPLARSIAFEIAIAVAILALVALWRFTPPPRSLAAAAPIEVHVHGERAMAHVAITPVRARDPTVDVMVLDAELRPLAVKEVTLILANPTAGIEPVRRNARAAGAANWRVEGLRIPVAGSWIVRVDLLISDFEKIVLEDTVDLPRLP